jgi:hypothetical protein
VNIVWKIIPRWGARRSAHFMKTTLATPFGPGALYGARQLITFVTCVFVMLEKAHAGSGYSALILRGWLVAHLKNML